MILTPFSRSQEGSDCWKLACLHSTSRINGWIFTKLVHLYCCDMEKNLLYFGDLNPIFKVTGKLILLENGLSAPYLMKKWMGGHCEFVRLHTPPSAGLSGIRFSK